MAIFTDGNGTTGSDGHVRRRIGWIILTLAVIGLVVFSLLPAPYAIEKPGPVFNTTGRATVHHRSVPVISVAGRTTYPTSGALDMLTVNITGDPERPPSWAEIAGAWFEPSEAVVPMDDVYAPEETTKESNEEGAQEMTESQQSATAAAFTNLGIHYSTAVQVAGTVKGSPAVGKLKVGDTVTSVDGTTFSGATALHNLIVAKGASHPLTIGFTRKGVAGTVSITPARSPGANPSPYIGVYLGETYTFPFDVKIQLQDVGGPSAGQMFALGIIDKLTPGKLNGGQQVAGTGTIVASGQVGAIGGIRQKMYGAREAGARYFLAPKSNCGGSDGVRGHIPSGLTVFATSSLTQSLTELKAIASGTGLASLPTCASK